MALRTITDKVQPQTRNSPVIVGDHYELAETASAGYVGELLGGLLAKPNGETGLLSMSDYEKFQNADPNGKFMNPFKAEIYLQA